MTGAPALHLIVGLPGVGKTTTAYQLADQLRAVRFTPDEWMIPLFGEPEANGKRDVLEGRLLWAAHEILVVGGSVILDFGCWVAAERWAIRALAEHAGAAFVLHFVEAPEHQRRARAADRFQSAPETSFEMSDQDHEHALTLFEPPAPLEFTAERLPVPPDGVQTWLEWASLRWPGLTLPDGER